MIKLHTLRSFLACISLTLISTPLWSFHAGSYAGLALEYQQFRGDRRDECGYSDENGGGSQQYAKFHDFDSSQVGFEVFGGCLYQPCFCDCILIGYEGYLACDFNKDTASGSLDQCHQVSTFRRLFNTGLLFKAGVVVCEDYFIYGIVGPDIGYFKWTQQEAGKGKVTDKKAMIGLRYGVGIEREFSCFRVGLQVDCTHYNPKTFSERDSAGDTPQSRIKPNILTVGLRFSVPLG
jgi:hypothetical protein